MDCTESPFGNEKMKVKMERVGRRTDLLLFDSRAGLGPIWALLLGKEAFRPSPLPQFSNEKFHKRLS